jgi:hypothetical protein
MCPWEKGTPLGEGRAPLGEGRLVGTYWFSIECPDGVVQVVSTRGVAVSITGCRLKPGSPGFSFIGNPAGRPVQHAPTLALKQLNFLMQFSPQPGRFRNWSKVLLDPDFSLTAWVVSKCPHWGQRPHTEATIPKRGGGVWGMWVSLALVWGGREDQLCQQRGRGSPRLCGGGQVKCRWWWFVALLINKGTPLGGGHAPGWRACPWVEGAPLGEGRAPGWRVRPWVKGAWWFFFSFFLRVLQLGVDDKTLLAVI